ncbi:peroxiredoxin [Sphingomonas xinjiangensis]|uniref:thioredoxin-dependent peroxiredoxin n=1 Tax=Sphingomonas xinjiangensis TaxID=643568 RepID=A0A840YIC8_9SPHN|nr:peroxiredoxin [Sphingomonas xinjiangensis]MBB5710618.1 peroxiredoxin Q/BCP [Sphingomonas xinjiangensis]
MAIEQGEPLPALTLEDADGGTIALADCAGATFVLYFYPKDDTAGCTREAQDFSALLPAFEAAGARVLGVSRDSAEKHRKFTAKHGLSVPLATDPEGAVMEAFGIWGEKQLYGRRYMGVDRSTFLFAADGTLHRAWRKVKVPGHAEQVLEAVKALGPQ